MEVDKPIEVVKEVVETIEVEIEREVEKIVEVEIHYDDEIVAMKNYYENLLRQIELLHLEEIDSVKALANNYKGTVYGDRFEARYNFDVLGLLEEGSFSLDVLIKDSEITNKVVVNPKKTRLFVGVFGGYLAQNFTTFGTLGLSHKKNIYQFGYSPYSLGSDGLKRDRAFVVGYNRIIW